MTVWALRRNGCKKGTFRPSFMGKTYFAGEMTDTERQRFEAERLNRAVCPKCGRPLSVSTITEHDAQLICSCGRRECVKRGSRAFKAAAIKVECERASR